MNSTGGARVLAQTFRRARKRRVRGLALVLAGLALLFIVTDNTMRPIIQSLAQARAKYVCTNIINTAMLQTLGSGQIPYDSLETVSRDAQGQVTSIEANSMRINQLKAELTGAVQAELNKYTTQPVSIPVGTLTGVDFLLGRGPAITVILTLTGSVNSTVENHFEAAGINQTRHQVMLVLHADIYIMIPWYNTSTLLDTNFILAETVIAGAVPGAFTQISGVSSGVSNDVADYGATGVSAPATPSSPTSAASK